MKADLAFVSEDQVVNDAVLERGFCPYRLYVAASAMLAARKGDEALAREASRTARQAHERSARQWRVRR